MSIHVNFGDDSFEFYCADDDGYEEDSEMVFCESTPMSEILLAVDEITGGGLSIMPHEVVDNTSGLHVHSFQEVEDGRTYQIIRKSMEDSD